METCKTCGQDFLECPGHFGFIKLNNKIFHNGYFKKVIAVLRLFCFKCGKLVVPVHLDASVFSNVTFIKQKAHFERMVGLAKEAKVCYHCKAIKEHVKKLAHGFNRLLCTVKSKLVNETNGMYDHYDSELILHNGTANGLSRSKLVDEYELTPDHVFKILSNINLEHWKYLLMNKNPPLPQNLIISVIPVPPLSIRPTVSMADNKTNEDDITIKLFEILKQTQLVDLTIAQGKDLAKIEEQRYNIQLLYNQLLNSECSEANAVQNNFNSIKGLLQRIKGKQGRFRANLSGKRVEFSGRTVISPDPNIGINEVNVPMHMAMELTFPETASKRNINRLRETVRRGPLRYPGANFVTLSSFKGKIYLKNQSVCMEVAKKLRFGDIVHRHLTVNDVVLFNRQPSLHRQSIMAFKARVHTDKTLKFNECVCSPFNADFDGDEMNIHVVQTISAKAEALYLMQSSNNLLNPKSGEVNISLIQDFLTTIFVLSSKDCFLNRQEFCSLLGMATNCESQVQLPKPTMFRPHCLWTGKQLISCVLEPDSAKPKDIALTIKEKAYNGAKNEREFDENDGFVHLRNSKLLSGQIGKNTMGSSKTGLLYYICKQHSNTEGAEVMARFAKLSAKYIESIGITFGLRDVTPDSKTEAYNKTLFASKINETRKVLEKYTKKTCTADFQADLSTMSIEEKAELEAEVTDVLNKARDEAGSFLLDHLSARNNALTMAISGAKGSSLNICQMIATVGQQIVSGKRVQNGFLNRTLPHFVEHELSPESRGFVQNSFYTGLRPTEFFFHTMAGREGLIDTAVKTADTGYMQRRLMKVMEDLVVEYDYTVRNSDKKLVQFFYGEDGFDPQMNEIDEFPIDLSKIITPVQAAKSEAPHTADLKQDFWSRWQKTVPNYEPSTKFKTHIDDFLDKVEAPQTVDKMLVQLTKSLIQPGDAVGALTAQSLGEPCTQMTLKTFHFAGVASMNVTMGVPRIKEIFNAADKITTPIIDVKLNNKYDAEAAKLIKNQINAVYLRDVISSIEEVYESNSSFVVLHLNTALINSAFVNVS